MTASMTGAGSARRTAGGFDIAVRARSVNSRFLDINIRMPHAFAQFEPELRQACAQKLGRGKVDILIDIADHRPNAVTVTLNAPLANAALQAINRLREIASAENRVDLQNLISIPGVLNLEPTELDNPDRFLDELKAVVVQAVDDLASMRRAEGKLICTDLLARLDTCSRAVEKIDSLREEIKTELHERLRSRIEQLLDGVDLDKERLAQEAAFLVDRSDISEEIVRLHSHFEQMRNLLKKQASNLEGAPKTTGKKLDFLTQEMAREINTVGAKSKNIELTQLVIEIKSELEKIREQVQNIE